MKKPCTDSVNGNLKKKVLDVGQAWRIVSICEREYLGQWWIVQEKYVAQ